MSTKNVIGTATFLDQDGRPLDVRPNVAFRYMAQRRAIYRWNSNNAGDYRPLVYIFPWKGSYLLADDDPTVGHAAALQALDAEYPGRFTTNDQAMDEVSYPTYRRARTVDAITSGNIPRVFGGVMSLEYGSADETPVHLGLGDGAISHVDVPLDYTQIGIVYFHPIHSTVTDTLSMTAGSSIVTYANGTPWDGSLGLATAQGVLPILRIETGADAGYYFITHNDYYSNRLYLRNLDGSNFIASATYSSTASVGPGRRAWFNETGIIPLSVGTLSTSGRYAPRSSGYLSDNNLRESFICRLTLDKTGSTEAASGTEQQGTYLLSLRPFTHGTGVWGSQGDINEYNNGLHLYSGESSYSPARYVQLNGGANGIALDWINQRLWMGFTNNTNSSSIFMYRWKTSESFREVANSTNNAPQASYLTPTPVLGTGTAITSITMGSNIGSAANWCYVGLYHATGGKGGLLIIKPDLTTLQYDVSIGGFPNANLAGCLVDKSRTRTGSSASTNGSNEVTATGGQFTNADIGRAIKLTGLGADSGIYKISSVSGATTVVVTTMADAAVAFTSQSGGSFEINDRLYFLFANGTTGAGKINYMEALVPGTWLTRTVSMTNGANINARVTGGSGLIHGQKQLCDIDPASGEMYWLTNDSVQQINKYDPATNTHSRIPITDTALLNPAGGVVVGGASPATNPGSPSYFSAIKVSTKFDDIWVASDSGHFRLKKSAFGSAGTRRYYGSSHTTYAYGTPTVSGTGNGSSGLTFSTPTVTLNASGTPFTPQMVGKYVVLTGATSAGNNGVFTITAYNSSSSITYSNSSGATQANYAGSFHIVDSWNYNTDGSYENYINTRIVRGYAEAPDGRIWTQLRPNDYNWHNAAYFSQESQNFVYRGEYPSSNNVEAYAFDFVEPTSSRGVLLHAGAVGGSAKFLIHGFETEYQWDGAKWIPLEWAKTETPLKVGPDAADGSTTLGSSTFTGSQFYSSDVDSYIRIQSGSDIGIYRISSYGSATSVSLSQLNGLPFVATATGGSISYTKSKTAQFARPIHSTDTEVVYGVSTRFNRQGGATPPNNEFLGRLGQARVTNTDGSTTSGTGTFNGSGFVAGDVGKYLRIESGAGLLSNEYKTYKITAYSSPTTVTVKNLNGYNFVASASVTNLKYTVWDAGVFGSTAGPENITFLLADGFSKDNTQDLSGLRFDAFCWKTRFSENMEQRKFTVENPLALPGTLSASPAIRAYFETYPRVTRSAPTTGGQYDAALSHHRALPSAELLNGRQMLDWHRDRNLNGTSGRADTYSSPANTTDWHGNTASNSTLGCSAMVDLGRNAEIGYIQIRYNGYADLIRQAYTANQHGMIANLYRANDAATAPKATYTQDGTGDTIGGTAPNMTLTDTGAAFTADDVGSYLTIQGAATASNNGTFLITAFTSTTQITYTNASGVAQAIAAGKWFISNVQRRTSGSLNLSATADNTTLTLSSGNFFGSVVTSLSNGQITAGQNTFVAPLSTFTQSNVGMVLNITAGAALDLGGYRIISVSVDGTTATVRNLTQTATAWNGSASGIAYEVLDAVREEDQILFFDSGGAEARCCVERLLTSTTLQVRTPPSAAATNVNWWCLAPNWTLVKRLSYSTEATPPDVKNNGTWLTTNGRDQYNTSDGLMYFDLTDLTAAQRTGRWWKWAGLPRFAGDSGTDAAFNISSIEFFDTAGNKLGLSPYTITDQARTNADFYYSWIGRVDFIQAASDAQSGVSGLNGNANLGGVNGNTVTLVTGGNKFLGFQIGPVYVDGNPITGGNTFNSTAAAFPVSASPGRLLWIRTGVNAGYYRILARVSASQITVVPPSGIGSTTFSTTETSLQFSVHEGVSVGGTWPDKFVFRRLGTSGDVTTTVSTSTINSASGSFSDADRGKIIRIFGASADNDAYLITRVNSATQITVKTTLGEAVSFLGSTGGTFEITSDAVEYRVSALSDDLTTITIEESGSAPITNRSWEIRRPGYDTSSSTVEVGKVARLIRPAFPNANLISTTGGTYPVQSGDVTNDHSGVYRFFSEDIGGSATPGGGGYQRADGTTVGGNASFQGSGFSADDVGRLLYVDTGSSKGVYEIATVVSGTSITVKDHFTGGAIVFGADAAITYRVFGDRRFRLTRYATGLRA